MHLQIPSLITMTTFLYLHIDVDQEKLAYPKQTITLLMNPNLLVISISPKVGFIWFLVTCCCSPVNSGTVPVTGTPTTTNPGTGLTPTTNTPFGSTTPTGVIGGNGFGSGNNGLGPSGVGGMNTDYTDSGSRLQLTLIANVIAFLFTLLLCGHMAWWQFSFIFGIVVVMVGEGSDWIPKCKVASMWCSCSCCTGFTLRQLCFVCLFFPPLSLLFPTWYPRKKKKVGLLIPFCMDFSCSSGTHGILFFFSLCIC